MIDMCFVLNVIKLITILYLLNCDLCHALSDEEITEITTEITVDSTTDIMEDFEEIKPPKISDSLKKILEKLNGTSDSGNNYEDIVFGNMESDEHYKNLYDYTMDENNICFLDNLKKNLLWWSHLNGSLITNGEKSRFLTQFKKYRRILFC